MQKASVFFRVLALLASIPFLYFVFTDKEPNWLYHLSLGIILGSTIMQMILDWRLGKHKEVKRRLLTYAVLIAVFVIIALVFKK